MRKGILLVGLVLVLMLGVSSVWADDDSTPKPGTPADNECNVGGVLYREENQDGCPTLWYWKAGWFLARFNRGFISRADFPKEFESVLPPLEKADWTCWNTNSVGTFGISIRYIGPANQKGNITGYFGSNCTGPEIPIPGGRSFVAFANSKPEAAALCALQGTVQFTENLNSIGWYDAPANVYGCVVS
jgi:hypothetical protein